MTIDSNTVSNIVTGIGAIAAAGYTALPLLLWKKKLNLDTLHTVATVAEKVVAAIEQTQSGATGDSKKALALSNMESILASLGLKVPEPFIDAALEAAVLLLGGPQSPPPPAAAGATPAQATTITYDASGQARAPAASPPVNPSPSA